MRNNKSSLKTSIFLILFLIAILSVGIYFVLIKSNPSNLKSSLNTTNEAISNNQPTVIPTPTSIKYDRSTNLKQELESINPEVKDDDFNSVKEVILKLSK